jgi:uncharacterized protein YycO
MKILAYKGKSWISKIIRWKTRSEYSHVAIELDDGSVVEAWHIGGVAHNKDFTTVHTKGTEVDVFEIIGEFNETEAEAFALSQVGKKYDFSTIGRFISGRTEPKDGEWICSEFDFVVVAKGGVYLLERIPAPHISPGQLITSPLLKYIEKRIS